MERKYKEQLILALIVIAVLLFAGTLIFHLAEGWNYIDSFYFTGVTLTTLGYGDLVPSHSVSKIITVAFSMIGIGIVLYGVTLLARLAFEEESTQIESMLNRRVQHRLSEERKAKEEVEKEVQERAKEVEEEAVKIAKELTEKEINHPKRKK